MFSTTIILLLCANLIVVGYYLYRQFVKGTPAKNNAIPANPSPTVVDAKVENEEKLNLEEFQRIKLENNNLQQALEVEKKKNEEKNKKVWLMNEMVYKEKKKADELNEQLNIEKEKVQLFIRKKSGLMNLE
jgi:hypothetical protein